VTSYALGIDIGTTGVKALLVDRDGRVVARGAHRHGLDATDRHVEADPAGWWRSVCRALALIDPDLRARVDAVGLSGNMSSIVLVDAAGEALMPAILLADPRGGEQLDALRPEYRARILAQTGNVPATVFSLSTLLWLRDERPDLLARAHALLTAKDYVRLRLTGTIGTEITDAFNTLLVAAGTRTWDRTLIDALGLPAALFPPMSPSGEPAGAVHPEAAAATGLPAGTEVVAGVGDMAAMALGAGECAPGTALISLGTSVTALTRLDAVRPPELRPGMTWHPMPDPDPTSFSLASLVTGGLALNWLREVTGTDPATMPVRPLAETDPLVFVPHLAGAGTPEMRPEANGTLLGLRPSTTAADLVSALFEAIAFELADVVAGARSLVLTGGGTYLPGWVAAITDVLQLPTGVLSEPDVSALGAARIACGRAGPLPSPALSTRQPDPRARGAWRGRHERYRQARAISLDYYARHR